jgi:uncharacterized protein (TIGR03086 family)
MELVDALEATFAHTHAVIAGVQPDQYDDPTPCTEWTVRDLLGHVIGVVAMFGQTAGGEPPTEFVLAPDPAAQFADAAKANLAAWRTTGILEQTLNLPAGPMPGQVYATINLIDTATHTWDLATATRQQPELPTDVAAAAYAVARQFVGPDLRAGRFAAEIPCGPDATTTQQLVAFLGRTT